MKELKHTACANTKKVLTSSGLKIEYLFLNAVISTPNQASFIYCFAIGLFKTANLPVIKSSHNFKLYSRHIFPWPFDKKEGKKNADSSFLAPINLHQQVREDTLYFVSVARTLRVCDWRLSHDPRLNVSHRAPPLSTTD